MDNVVYILGAGFSAPLGLPVMKNFLMKSKDMFAEQPDKYAHFKRVFELINEMSTVKNYFAANLFNIEEILSIVEMRARIGEKEEAPVTKYICDVIQHFTPAPFEVLPEGFRGNWHQNLADPERRWEPYVSFALSLLGADVKQSSTATGHGSFIFNYSATPIKAPKARYSVITLNYDLVLETVSTQMRKRMQGGWKLNFQTDFSKQPSFGESVVPLAKLHGSVDTGSIIAPTWNKAVSKEMESTWQQAHKSLEEANQIRFIGYSLPEADAYIRYLLKSAIINCRHLRNIDVIGPGMIESNGGNYREFISFYEVRYSSATFEKYGSLLAHKSIHQVHPQQSTPNEFVCSFDKLEETHNEIMLRS